MSFYLSVATDEVIQGNLGYKQKSAKSVYLILDALTTFSNY